MKGMRVQYHIGIDEVGRGPLAGPVAVGALLASPRILRQFRTIKESKQLSASQRDVWYSKILDARGDELRFTVSFVSSGVIDKKGITHAIRLALVRSITKLHADPRSCKVLLDGGLRAPNMYTHQQTIIHGDAQETIIAMASVVAKVKRDRMMIGMDSRYPDYGFRDHKGYGTKRHIDAIRMKGITPLHRKSFCTRVFSPSISS